jgi:hypothetical protein
MQENKNLNSSLLLFPHLPPFSNMLSQWLTNLFSRLKHQIPPLVTLFTSETALPIACSLNGSPAFSVGQSI